MVRQYALRDDNQWEWLQARLPGLVETVGVTGKDNRSFVEAVLYRYRSGSAWQDLPERFGDWKNVQRRFSRWAERGVWAEIFNDLAADSDNEYMMIDSRAVRAYQHCGGAKKKAGEDQAIGRSVGGLSTKIHALVDTLDNPAAFYLTPGQPWNLDGADILLPSLKADARLANKTYDANARVIEPLHQDGKIAVIPPKANPKTHRPHDKAFYKVRYRVENFFYKPKSFRAIATRYDKTARHFLAAIHLAYLTTRLTSTC